MRTKLIIAGLATLPAVALAFTLRNPESADYGTFRGREATQAAAEQKAPAKAPMKRVAAYYGQETAEVEKYGKLVTVIEEDFSLLTTGSEDAPDTRTVLNKQAYLTDEYGNVIYDKDNNAIPNPDFEYPWNNMYSKFTHQPGWGCDGGWSAGGMMYFKVDEKNPQAHVVTPIADLTANDGTCVLEFRAKAKKGTTFPEIYIETAETNNWAPSWDIYDDQVTFSEIPDEWNTFRVIYQGAGPTTLFNIVAQGFEGEMFIDDIKVYTLEQFVATPRTLRHSDYTDSSFTANWSPVEGADSYLLNIYYTDDDYKPVFAVQDKKVEGTSFAIDGLEDQVYSYTLRAVKGDQVSLESKPREVYDVMKPVMKEPVKVDRLTFRGSWEPARNAYGTDYMAIALRKAEADGPMTLTDEDFSGARMPDGTMSEWTIEKPNDQTLDLYYPTDITQQGWYGQHFAPYKGFICLDTWFRYHGGGEVAWISPEFDYSKDGGNLDVSVKLAGKPAPYYDENGKFVGNLVSQCAVALFDWDETKNDYTQTEAFFTEDVGADWKEFKFHFTKGSKRSVIAFFGWNGDDNLYIDDIRITQNYKAGETFADPFFFRYFALVENPEKMPDPTSWEFQLTTRQAGADIYDRARSARIILTPRGEYTGQVYSGWTDDQYVTDTNSVKGISLDEPAQAGNARVENGILHVENPAGADVILTAIDGRAGLYLGQGTVIEKALPSAGTWIVRIGTKTVKVIG